MTNLSFALNANNDIYIGSDGNLVMVSGVDAIAQDCACKMKVQLGEMIYQPLDGLPYLTDIWLQKSLASWQAAARQQLSTVPGVQMVKTLTFSVIGDVLSYTAEIQSTYSQSFKISGSITGIAS